MSLRSVIRLGSALSAYGMARLGRSLRVLEFGMVGSSLSLRAFIRLGSSLSFYGMSRLGSSFSLLDFIHLGSSLSLRSFVRLGSCMSVYGMARVRALGQCDERLRDGAPRFEPLGARLRALRVRDESPQLRPPRVHHVNLRRGPPR
jgi:hypothetical protein